MATGIAPALLLESDEEMLLTMADVISECPREEVTVWPVEP